MTTRVQLPALGHFERVRLWLSYQRYAFLLLLVPPIAIAALATVAPWWVLVIAGIAAIPPIRFGIEVWGRWPRKERATRVALVRIATNRFEPRSIRSYCGDPCFRTVAREILVRAGTSRDERERIVATYREELRREANTLFLIDHSTGTVTAIERTET